jgi:hypothetical protein
MIGQIVVTRSVLYAGRWIWIWKSGKGSLLYSSETFYVVRYSCDVTDDILIPLPYDE